MSVSNRDAIVVHVIGCLLAAALLAYAVAAPEHAGLGILATACLVGLVKASEKWWSL